MNEAVKEHIQTDHVEAGRDNRAADDLEREVRSVLDHAVDAHRRDLKVYQSLKNLNEVIGTEYGDRVLYELIQNAHDAHRPGGDGRIAIELIIRSRTEGVLHVANGGNGFRWKDVEAIRNLATSAKEVGEGIGNKGLGFRSVEALTDDVHIYSRVGESLKDRFDGYCFGFAEVSEIEDVLRSTGVDAATSRSVAQTMPRYLVPRPLKEHPDHIAAYARRGYATVVAAPLRTAEAVALAAQQVVALAELDVPLLLFLDRIAEIRIDVVRPDQKPYRRRLSRRQTTLSDVPSLPGTRTYEVDVGEGRRFLVVRRAVDKDRALDAVARSIPAAPQLKRWLNWKGEPVVSVAVGLSMAAVTKGRLYNFLPMGEEAASPFLGHLDAPFFSDINRRDADLILPLNETLMAAAAEACAAGALHFIDAGIDVPQRAVFDLIAWTGQEAGKIDKALDDAGSALSRARFVPIIHVDRNRAWASLEEVSLWPADFSLLKARDLARHVGAQLVSGELDDDRVVRLRDVARRAFPFRSLLPSRARLAGWMEAFAESLAARNVGPRTWSRFYDDVVRVFEETSADLDALKGKRVLIDRSGKLHPAGGHTDQAGKGLYVRSEAAKGKRTSGGVPVPPARLTRRYRFLHDKVSLKQETLDEFVKAHLVRKYDPVEALAGLKSVLGRKASETRRLEALLWAFRVWRVSGSRVENILREAELYVPTLSGWRAAGAASFSASWTQAGGTLENFLFEAADVSPDCRRSREGLLIGFQEWPGSELAPKKRWIEFLEIVGVANDLRPVPCRFKREGVPAYHWDTFVRDGDAAEGFDGDWCAEVDSVTFRNPYTDRQAEGKAWRFPGQLEHGELSETAREGFCTLVFEHLRDHGDTLFYFRVGKFDRSQREWDPVRLPTPLATFLRYKPWVAVTTNEGVAFRCPDECWGARSRTARPPRFMERLPNAALSVAESGERAELIFGDALGIRDWQSKETAVERLSELGGIAPKLSMSDRPRLRDECRRAWSEIRDGGHDLSGDLAFAVSRHGQLEALVGDTGTPPSVVVTQDAQRSHARILAEAGYAILDVGDIPVDEIAGKLEATGSFNPQLIDSAGVRLLVDGEPFVASASDDLLTSHGLDWFPELAVIANEVLGERLERGIPSAHIERRTRAIRLRTCGRLSLLVGGKEVDASRQILCWAHEHNTLPTLIIAEMLPLTWRTLALELCNPISRLIDTRLRALERPLHRLALMMPLEQLERPSDEALACALGCSSQTLQEHRLALQSDFGRVLEMLAPVVAYYGGPELAAMLRADAERIGVRFDPTIWVKANLIESGWSPEEMLAACEQAADRRELQNALDLEFARFNWALIELGEAPITNEDELRQLYSAYLARMSGEILDRLRRRYLNDYRTGGDLRAYVEYKNLAFLPFNTEWILNREDIDMEVVQSYISPLLDETLGPDTQISLGARNRVVEANRRSLRGFADEALPVVRAWSRRNDVVVPAVWQNDETQALAREIEGSGLLDFEVIPQEQMAALCARAGCWPEGMPKTVDRGKLGLEATEVVEEVKRREEARRRIDIARRTVDFGGTPLDTGDLGFAEKLKKIADASLSRDDSWFKRSSNRIRLVEFATSEHPDRGGPGRPGKGRKGRRRQLTDAQRSAMGIASELLALEYLRLRHPEYVDESCWVSENRAHFFGGDPGDDAAGFDFRVETPRTEWLYEVKSSLEDSGEFELTANELRVASGASKDGRRRYRILYVPYVFSPDRWYVLELPNPMGEATRNRFATIGRGSVRLRFERR